MSRPATGLPVLTYHSISAGREPTATHRDWFISTLDTLREAGFHGVDLEEWVRDGRPDIPRGFALAFDDGLRSILDVAETLIRERIRATVFLVTDRVGKDRAWPGSSRHLPREPLLSWPEINGLAGQGVRFGAHGKSHVRLDRCSPTRLVDELRGSRDAIENRLGRSCSIFAYPYGAENQNVRKAASRVFDAAFGTRLDYSTERQNLWDLSRIDACYLRTASNVSRLVNDRWRGRLIRRRVLRRVKRLFVGWAQTVEAARESSGTPEAASLVATRRPCGCLAVAPSDGPARDGSSVPMRLGESPLLVCPLCRASLLPSNRGLLCSACGREFPMVAGLIDLRIESDRYLSLADERAKAEHLRTIEAATDVLGLAAAYYARTGDVGERRRERFLRHIAVAEARGAALAGRLPPSGRVLEVGCGTGGLLVAAAKRGLEISGVDIASRWLVVARRRLTDRGLSVFLAAAEAERLPWPEQTFDAIVVDSVLEHVDDPAVALSEFRRVLKPGGRLLVWSPNRFTLTTDPHLGLWGLGWLPRSWVPGYLRLRGRRDWAPRTLSAFEVRRLVKARGFFEAAIDPPAISDPWVRTRSSSERIVISAYNAARSFTPGRSLLTAIGPLWELTATPDSQEAA